MLVWKRKKNKKKRLSLDLNLDLTGAFCRRLGRIWSLTRGCDRDPIELSRRCVFTRALFRQ